MQCLRNPQAGASVSVSSCLFGWLRSPAFVLSRIPCILTQGTVQVARAYVVKGFQPGGDLNGAGRTSKSEQAGWLLAVDRGGRIAPERRFKEVTVNEVAQKFAPPKGALSPYHQQKRD